MKPTRPNTPVTSVPHGTPGARFAILLAWIALLVSMVGRAATAQTPISGLDPADRRCMQCHGQARIANLTPAERRAAVGTWLDTNEPAPGPLPAPEPLRGDEIDKRPGLFVHIEVLAAGPHAKAKCVECHEDAAKLPHPMRLNLSTCATSCHAEARRLYDAGAHAAALAKGNDQAPTCTSCHGGHDVLKVSDRKSPQHRLNSLYLCGDCHKRHGFKPEGREQFAQITSYLDSAHAKGVTQAGLLGAATCSDCHGAHGVLPSKDPASSVSRARVPETCGKCHEGVLEKYTQSVHGLKRAEGDDKAAVCSDCHTAHAISQASAPGFMRDVINECGHCHDSTDRNGGRLGTYYKSYLESYHGQVVKLGAKRAARCSDCHGSHDIHPLKDPSSRVAQANLVKTCAQCHPNANENFVRFDPHANYRDAKNYPILHGVWLYFMILMGTVFTFFGLHTILWFSRSMAERLKHGAPHAHARVQSAIRRFTTIDRVNHALVAITFFGLTATGIPLVFSRQHWAGQMAKVLGGVEFAGLLHRIFAAMLIFNLVLHFVGLAHAYFRRTVPLNVWLFGANSLLPRWKDAQDVFGMFRWFFGLGRRPALDRWTYWEKFDYWAEVGGSFIIGGSGLLLWFPEIASKVLPGWAFNIAMVVHGYEALLAIGFIFTIHFFNAHVRPGAFPVDEVIFTGSMPEQELQEQRPAEYDRLVKSGKLEALRVQAPPPERRRVHVVIAVASVTLGLVLLTFIILGGLGLF